MRNAVPRPRLDEDLLDFLCKPPVVDSLLDQIATKPFDLILANIYGDILLALADRLAARSRPGAPLLLSGILYQDNFEVRRRYEAMGCVVVVNRMLEEFTTVLLRKGA